MLSVAIYKIHKACSIVHLTERSSSNPGGYERVQAVRNAIKQVNLNKAERDILCNALHVSVNEL